MLKTRPGRWAFAAALTTAVAACGPTEPEVVAEMDTEAALADYEALDAVLASEEFAGFKALAGRTPFSGGTAGGATLVTALGATDAGSGRAYAVSLARRLAAAGSLRSPSMAPVISDTHRGAVFVYDPESDDYTIDPERTDGPPTGVRFIIYEVDDDGYPIVDEEIGHADLIDEGDDSVEDIVLRLSVVQHGVQVLDYRTSLDEDANRGTLTVRGFLRGDRVRLDFDIEATGTREGETTTLDVAFDVRVDARGFSITGNVRGVEEGTEGEGDIDITVRHRTHSVRLEMRGADGVIDGTVFLNGDVFATVSGPAEAPTFLGRTGEPITIAEMLVLRRIVDALEDVFDFLEDLLDPVDDLVVLGIIL